MKGNRIPPISQQQGAVWKTERIELSPGQVLEYIQTQCPPVEEVRFGRGRDQVILLPEAWEELRALVHYGRPHAASLMEQQFQGMGHVFEKDGVITVVISHILHQYSASRTPVHAAAMEGPGDIALVKCLAMERELYRKYEHRCNRVGEKEKDPFLIFGGSELILFGHTHPDLGAFFSAEDGEVHRATQNFPAVSLVCDPIRREFKAMVGIERREAEITLYSYAGEGDENDRYESRVSWLRRLARAVADGLNQSGVSGRYRVWCGRDRRVQVRVKLAVDPPVAGE